VRCRWGDIGGEMTTRPMKKERSAPLWAVLGAPLVGVPLMVGLLSLAAPKHAGTASTPEAGLAIQQVRSQADDSALKQGREEFDSVFLGG
jgi:hypothetical protein